HSPFDGLVPVVANHFVYSSLDECQGVWKGSKIVGRDLLPPRRLDFYLDDYIKVAIEESKKIYQTNIADCEIEVGCFTHYGKAFLKPHNFHPETYAQFALQLAYYTMHGRPAPTYVTAATRQFYHGRTETMRSCFPEV
ncbi:Peroxisomal carnitine O-octanoyltransferase, partial [Araneus ventricosus]